MDYNDDPCMENQFAINFVFETADMDLLDLIMSLKHVDPITALRSAALHGLTWLVERLLRNKSVDAQWCQQPFWLAVEYGQPYVV
jgi:hypothetical protein